MSSDTIAQFCPDPVQITGAISEIRLRGELFRTMANGYHCEESSSRQEKPVTEGYEASTPKNSDVKPTALGLLMDAKGGAGKLVRAYASKDDEEDDWLESWFLNRTQLHCASHIPEGEQVVPIELEATHAPKLGQRPGLRLVSIRPHYFRGYKALLGPIDLTGSLIVIEGKNSSGKTSLAEALEFLFRGSLSRREEHGEGNPEELENCIENQLRPSDESTFVEAAFVKNWGAARRKTNSVKAALDQGLRHHQYVLL